MDKQTLIEKIKAMAAAPSCCAELRAAVKDYLDALGTSAEKNVAENLIAEIEADITTVENMAVQIFGAEGAKKFAAHADELKASGAKYCDCGACAPGVEILQHKAVLLA